MKIVEPYFIEKVMEQLSEINTKLDTLIEINGYQNKIPALEKGSGDNVDKLDVLTLLALPDHLRVTATTLYEIGTGTAEDVSNRTGKERAVESNYLNQLERMDCVEKVRKGRKVYFRIK